MSCLIIHNVLETSRTCSRNNILCSRTWFNHTMPYSGYWKCNVFKCSLVLCFIFSPLEKPKPPLTVCQQHKESLQESLSIYPGLEAFIPQCDEKGQYKPLQCLGTSGHCWCVDGRGQERVGTRTMPGSAHANCDQPGMDLCPHILQLLLTNFWFGQI